MANIGNEEGSNAGEDVIQQSTSASRASMNNLDDDCLAKIFKYLPWEQRLKIETVCKRWREASKFAWDDVSLKFSEDAPDMTKLPLRLRNTKNIGRILMRCGAYVKKLHVGKLCKNVILSIVAQHCNNLRELELQFEYHDINWGQILSYMERLESLRILDDSKVNDEIFLRTSAFKNLKYLRHFKLSDFFLGFNLIDAIGQKHDLIHLDLSSSTMSEPLTPLLHLENLKYLHLKGVNNVDDNF